MSEEDKSQAATPKRRADALKEGNVWAPKELAPAAAVITAAGLAGAMGEKLWWALAGFLAEALSGAGAIVARGEDGVPAGWLARLTPWQGPLVLALAITVLTAGLAQAATRHV
ncbi:EscU/YscU/HrcU family type III secretion system export apparatus switch protein, partial [Polymorphobacter sp.]|uniref:EscU/YscU/HrcU family type III secretion system export apparatus switch protein n=1 Tax=Polymorphobacter sp. TaxID=1909290 RepID=UPI003F6E99F8